MRAEGFIDFIQGFLTDCIRWYCTGLLSNSFIYLHFLVFFGLVKRIDLGYLLWTYLWQNSFIYLHLSILIKFAGVGELRGSLIYLCCFLRIVSGDAVQSYYQTFSYIFTFWVWCFLVRLKKFMLDFLWSYWWSNSFVYFTLVFYYI